MNQATRRYFSPRNRPTLSSALAPFVLLLALVAWGRANLAGQTSSKPAYPHEISRITFAAAGDVIPHQAVVEAAAANTQKDAQKNLAADSQNKDKNKDASAQDSHGGWDALFADVADVFRHVDFGFVNLETPVAPVHSQGTRSFQFNAPIELVQALQSSGVKIVSFANNHVFDQGHDGFSESIDHLREQGMFFTGAGSTASAAWKPVILEKNGIKVGWLGMTRWLNGHRNPDKDDVPHVAFLPYPGEAGGAPGLDEAGLLEAVKAARAQCDLLLVSIHWGIEYSPEPRPDDIELAHKILDTGADAVIGHHPHVLQPIETYVTTDQRNAVVVYSLGNFLSNQSRFYVQGLMPDKTGDPRDSMVIKFSVVKKDYGPAGIRTELADFGMIPVWTENNRLLLRSGRATQPFIRPVFIDREIPLLQTRVDELDHLAPNLSKEQKQELVQVSSQLKLLQHRREVLLDRTGDEYLIAPPAVK